MIKSNILQRKQKLDRRIIPFFFGLIVLLSECKQTPTNGQLTGSTQSQTWEQLTSTSVGFLKKGDIDNAKILCNEAISLTDKADSTCRKLAKSYVLKGEIYRWEKKNDSAEICYKYAIEVSEKILGKEHPDIIVPLESLANFYLYTQTDYNKVALLYKRILDITEKIPNVDEREIAVRACNLANIYLKLGEPALAEPLYISSLNISEKHKNENDIYNHLINIAGFYRQWNNCEKAELYAVRALKMKRVRLQNSKSNDDKLDISICLDTLGKIYLTCRKPKKAEPLYKESLAIAEKISGKDSPDLSNRLIGLAESYRWQKKFNIAEPLYRRAISINEKAFGENYIGLANMLDQYSFLLKEMNKLTGVKALQARANLIRSQNRTVQ